MRESDWNDLGFEHVGDADVDSGQIMIVDPCYVLPRDGKSPHGWIGNTREISYNGLLDHYSETNSWYEPHVTPWGNSFGFISGTLYGDGHYPIYGRKSGTRYSALVIDFDPDTEYDDEYEDDDDE